MMDIVDRLRAMGGYLDYDCEVTLSSIADEIQTLRAKVASAEVLVEALQNAIQFISGSVRIESNSYDEPPSPVSEWEHQADNLAFELNDALATYEKLSEVKE